ncbi:hypothetical protein [Amycolatopsis orientalis]|uniref:hypothetical protein n=1 Tax=Amycolatopsis orientalis TaxID=31958 RepID=UPI001268990A|nr:hypothetical protein [Amycolatopsis orientalis]
MGVESMNYGYVPLVASQDLLEQSLRELATREFPESGGLKQYVVSGDRYWIDVEFSPATSEGSRSYASVRVALTNPPDVEDAARTLFGSLLNTCGGRVVALSPREKFTTVEEPDWRRLWVRFTDKQKKFRDMYGTFELAASGADVFDYMRENNII